MDLISLIKSKMYCQRSYRQMFKLSRHIQRGVFSHSWLGCVAAQDNPRQLHTSIVIQKNAITLPVEPEEGFVKRIMKRVGWLQYPRSKLKAAGYLLYENVADKVPYPHFFEEFQMPDTFYSWFLITELHVWMLMVRTMAEKEEGSFVRNNIVEAMWHDVNDRAKCLEPGNPTVIRQQINELSEQFQAALIGYDEGLMKDDKVLASAIWRRFLQRKCNEPEHIECLVHYVRKQVKNMDELPRDVIFSSPNITWIDLPRKFDT